MYNGPVSGRYFFFCNGASAKVVMCTKFMAVITMKLKYSKVKLLGWGVCLDAILTALGLGAAECR
jgi:hypothetical protein